MASTTHSSQAPTSLKGHTRVGSQCCHQGTVVSVLTSKCWNAQAPPVLLEGPLLQGRISSTLENCSSYGQFETSDSLPAFTSLLGCHWSPWPWSLLKSLSHSWSHSCCHAVYSALPVTSLTNKKGTKKSEKKRSFIELLLSAKPLGPLYSFFKTHVSFVSALVV